MTAKWSIKSTKQIETILNTNAACGLSRKAARVRLKRGGENRIYNTETSGIRSYVSQMIGDLGSYLLIIAAIVAAVFDYPALSVVIFITWAVNIFVTFIVYIKADKTFLNSCHYSIPKTRVIREGKVYITDPRNIVRGDVVLLCEGDVAPCDLRLCDSRDLFVLEYDPDKKQSPRRKDASARIFDPECEPAAEANMVFAGAVVVTGEARAIAVDIGEDTYTVETVGLLTLNPVSSLPFLEELSKCCTAWSILMLILVIPITLVGMKNGFFDSFMLGLALASSTVSEMIVAIGRIILACSVTNAAVIGDKEKNTAIIKNISKIDSLSLFDTLLIFDDSVFTVGETVVDDILCENKDELLISALLASGIGFSVISPMGAPAVRSLDDIALEEYCESNKITRADSAKGRAFVASALSSEYNFDTVLVKEEEGFVAYLKGDAARILSHCTSYRKDQNDLPITAEIIERGKSFIEAMKEKNRRVFAVARKQSQYNSLSRISALQTDLTLMGLVALGDPVISCAREVLESFALRGIDVIFAANTKNEELRGLISDASLVSESYYTDSISEKKRIFAELAARGKRIAVIASKVSEIGMMKEASVSFCTAPDEFSRKSKDTVPYLTPIEKNYGTQIAKKEADVIIKRATDKRFGVASVLSAVDYASAAMLNISDMMKYLICTAFSRAFIVLLAAISGLPLICPSQVLFCGLVVDLLAVLVFAFEKPHGQNKTRAEKSVFLIPFKNNFFWAGLGTLTSVLSFVIALLFTCITSDISAADILAFGFVSLVISQLAVLWETTDDSFFFFRKIRLNAMSLLVVFAVCAVVTTLFLFESFGTYFDIKTGSVSMLPLSVVPGGAVFLACELHKFIISKKNK